MKTLAKILVIGGLLLATGFFWRSATHYDNNLANTDSGLKAVENAGSPRLPARLLIPKLEIDANVQRLGITKNGNMAAPNNFTDVSWYKLGTLPGQTGSAVISGHEDNAVSLDGVFKHLEDLELGDDIYVVDEGGQKLQFRVIDKKVLPYNLTGPELENIFHQSDKARLNLITCAGDWVQSIKTNDKRLVIYTELVK